MSNQITTIQIRENVKLALDRLKSKNQSYEEAIILLMSFAEKCRRMQKELLIEGCEVMASENLKISKEFEGIEDLNEWTW